MIKIFMTYTYIIYRYKFNESQNHKEKYGKMWNKSKQYIKVKIMDIMVIMINTWELK